MALFLTGTAGNDTLIGGAGADTLLGNAGNDYLDGGAGGDSLLGGAGNDTYVVDSVADIVTESALEGSDQVLSSISYTLGSNLETLTLTGSAAINGTGNNLGNTLQGNAANNVLTGGSGADFVFGNGGNDTIISGAGDDYLNGGLGQDSMVGGLGNDVYIVDTAGDVVVETSGQGYDEIRSSVSYALSATQEVELLTLSGTASINVTANSLNNDLVGNSGNNFLQGLEGEDWISGGQGNDTLDGGTGNDIMDGGAGNDTYYVDSVHDQVIESAATGGADQIFSSASYSLQGKYIERLTLTGSNSSSGIGNDQGNTLIGNIGNNALTTGAGADLIWGYAGNDSIKSGSGNDYIDGGAGQDTMTGGLGDDIYIVDNASDIITESSSEGWDTVKSSVTHTLGVNFEALTLTGNNAINAIGNSADNLIIGNNMANNITGGVEAAYGNDTIYGKGGDDTIVADGSTNALIDGGEGNDYIIGNSFNGSDTIYGGSGNDSFEFYSIGNGDQSRIYGGAGDDIYYMSQATQSNTSEPLSSSIYENENEGIDSVFVFATSYTLSSNIENLVLQGASSKKGYGNNQNNEIHGTNKANELGGAGGADLIIGGGGNDIYLGGLGADTLIADVSTSSDTYYWGRGEDADTLTDVGGNDTMNVLAGTSANQIWLEQTSTDLKISIIGSDDSFTIKNWFTSINNQVENIKLADGKTLSSARVQGLINAMSQFSPPPPGSQIAPSELTSAIAAAWI